ncbi:MAG: Asp-tRNA(Asn)/Glu-tRNA(Gln) amidotransferase subunit GatB [Cytophagales bacterium]
MLENKPSLGNEDAYRAVIGLEVHVQLKTPNKIFCPEQAVYGLPPNTQTSPVTLAHPGTLPTLDRQSVSYAIMLCLGFHATIPHKVWFDRKSYFYPDLPKGFQNTQKETPIGRDGYIIIDLPTGPTKISIPIIQIEEDSGKSIHALDGSGSFINFDRAGKGVIEFVTSPDFHNGESAAIFIAEARKIVRHLGISAGDMEKGELRCDANVSIMKKTDTVFGTKVEIKHLNSIRHIQLAINAEIKRQMEIVKNGGQVRPSTRGYDAKTKQTYLLRSKEGLEEYRFFTEPDLSPFTVTETWVQQLQAQLPPLPRELVQKFKTIYQLTDEDAHYLTEQKETSLFFEAICQHTTQYKKAANWVMGPIKAYLNESKLGWADFPITPNTIAQLINTIATGEISLYVATEKLLPQLLENPDMPLKRLLSGEHAQISNLQQLDAWVEEAIAIHADKVAVYQKGKTGIIGLFMKEVMHISEQKANPQKTMDLLRKKLNAKH